MTLTTDCDECRWWPQRKLPGADAIIFLFIFCLSLTIRERELTSAASMTMQKKDYSIDTWGQCYKNTTVITKNYYF
jgi:hypothetical protein